MTFLVDTNIIGELTRCEPNAGVLAWAGTVSVVSLSVITVEEMLFGLAWKPNARIEAWIEGFLTTRCRIHAVTDDIARAVGRLQGTLARRGLTRSQADMLIAAIAQMHQETLVARNVRDFEECGIGLLNPFS
jgi:toxin FitB